MHHGPSWACAVISELAAEHKVVIDEAGLKAAGIAQVDGLPAVAVVGPEVEDQHSEEVGAVLDALDPGVGNHLVGAPLAGSLDETGAEMDSGAGADGGVSIAEPEGGVLVEKIAGDFYRHPVGGGQSGAADQRGTDDLVGEGLGAGKAIELDHVESAIRSSNNRRLTTAA